MINDSESQRIGRAGEDLFRTLLPYGWYKHRRDPDPFADFLVEPVVDGCQLPHSVYFQVKSTRSSVKKPKCRLEVKTLKFALDSKLPVFLAFIDIETRCAWFHDLGKLAKSLDQSLPIWDQEHTTIKLSKDNFLSSESLLLEAIHAAWDNLADLDSIGVEEAIRRAEQGLKRRDPRFDYAVTFGPDGEQLVCTPAGPDAVTRVLLTPRTKSGAQAIQSLIDEGGELSTGDDVLVELEDPPGQFGQKLEGAISFESKSEGTVCWAYLDDSGEQLGSCVFHVEWKGGYRRRKGLLKVPGADMFSGYHSMVFDEKELKVTNHFHVSVQHSKWSGTNVLRLKGFIELDSAIGPLSKASSLRAGPILNGEWIKGDFSIANDDELRGLGELIRLIATLRNLAEKLELDIVWNHTEVDQDVQKVYDLQDMTSEGGLSLGSGELEFVIDKTELELRDAGLSVGSAIKHEIPVPVVLFGRDCGVILETVTAVIVQIESTTESDGLTRVKAGVEDIVKKCSRYNQAGAMLTP